MSEFTEKESRVRLVAPRLLQQMQVEDIRDAPQLPEGFRYSPTGQVVRKGVVKKFVKGQAAIPKSATYLKFSPMLETALAAKKLASAPLTDAINKLTLQRDSLSKQLILLRKDRAAINKKEQSKLAELRAERAVALRAVKLGKRPKFAGLTVAQLEDIAKAERALGPTKGQLRTAKRVQGAAMKMPRLPAKPRKK